MSPEPLGWAEVTSGAVPGIRRLQAPLAPSREFPAGLVTPGVAGCWQLLLLIHSDGSQSHLSHMGTLRDHGVSLPALSKVLQV